MKTSEVEKCNQITNEVLDMQEPEDEDKGRVESIFQVKLEEINSNSNDKSVESQTQEHQEE